MKNNLKKLIAAILVITMVLPGITALAIPILDMSVESVDEFAVQSTVMTEKSTEKNSYDKPKAKNIGFLKVSDIDTIKAKGFGDSSFPILEVNGVVMSYKTAIQWVNNQ